MENRAEVIEKVILAALDEPTLWEIKKHYTGNNLAHHKETGIGIVFGRLLWQSAYIAEPAIMEFSSRRVRIMVYQKCKAMLDEARKNKVDPSTEKILQAIMRLK